jgi:hypothetical protein
MVKEKELPGAEIPGIIDLYQDAASAFTLNVYREPFTPAGVNAKASK